LYQTLAKKSLVSKIPRIAFLIFEESDVPLKRKRGESIIFDESNPHKGGSGRKEKVFPYPTSSSRPPS
jgi:hypothetical protein